MLIALYNNKLNVILLFCILSPIIKAINHETPVSCCFVRHDTQRLIEYNVSTFSESLIVFMLGILQVHPFLRVEVWEGPHITHQPAVERAHLEAPVPVLAGAGETVLSWGRPVTMIHTW